MKTFLAVLVVAVALSACSRSQEPENYAADNSGKNVRDRSDVAVTSGDQSNTSTDINITKAVREAVVANKELTTNAHNVKIITDAGVVTLRGPVASVAEKTSIAATAQRIAGVRRVDNQLEIAPY